MVFNKKKKTRKKGWRWTPKDQTVACATRIPSSAWEHITPPSKSSSLSAKQHVSTRHTELVPRTTWHFPSGWRHRSHPSRQNHPPTTHIIILLLAGFTLPIFSLSLLSFSQSGPNGTFLERKTKGWFLWFSSHHTGNKNPLFPISLSTF